MRARLVVVGVVAALLAPVPSEAAVSNVSSIVNLSYPHGTDNAFGGGYVYASQADGRGDGSAGDGGVHIVDVTGRKPRQVGFVECSGYQNDVAVVRPGLIAVGYHASSCGGTAKQAGIRLIDVRDPRRPKLMGSVRIAHGAHTITAYPGRPIIYASPGGSSAPDEHIIDASDPSNPHVAAHFASNGSGCHDVSFHFTKGRKLGFCAANTETLIWDVSDPLRPRTISTVDNGATFHHSAVASPDGKILVVGDENNYVHECVAGGAGPTGAIWIHDISDVANPSLLSYLGPRRGRSPVGVPSASVQTYCTAHNYNFIPGSRMLVGAWYSGGTSVIDLRDPAAPREVAFYQPDNALAWSSYWYRGRIYVTDYNRGLDVLELQRAAS